MRAKVHHELFELRVGQRLSSEEARHLLEAEAFAGGAGVASVLFAGRESEQADERHRVEVQLARNARGWRVERRS